MARTPFHAAYTLFHDAVVKKGFTIPSGEVSLPFQWDKDPDIVALKYTRNGKTIEVKCLLMEESLVANVVVGSEVRTLDLPIEYYISNFNQAASTYEVKNVENLERKIYEDMIYSLIPELKPVECRPPSEEQAQPARAPPAQPNPLRDERFQPRAPAAFHPFGDPFAVGEADLHPFGGRPGGMFMDPMRGPGGMGGMGGMRMRGRGFGPLPGARYDPIGPGGREPDNDELLPPGRRDPFGHDDMFM